MVHRFSSSLPSLGGWMASVVLGKVKEEMSIMGAMEQLGSRMARLTRRSPSLTVDNS